MAWKNRIVWVVTNFSGAIIAVYSSWLRANTDYPPETGHEITQWRIK